MTSNETSILKFQPLPPLDNSQMIEPKGWKMIVRPLQIEEKTDSGLYLSNENRDTLGQRLAIARVEKKGPLCYAQENRLGPVDWVNEGDYIICGRFGGFPYSFRGVQYSFINDDQVLAVLTEDQVREIEVPK
jgi:co-chaperonin GroES (HSP10)